LITSEYDFTPLHDAMQRYVDREILPGLSSAVLVGRDLVDVHCTGWADREGDEALRTDHIFRAFSNTKLMVSCAALLLWEEGHFQMEDPIEGFIPQLGQRRVLRPGATDIADTEPASRPITIRHLLSHSSGLNSGFVDPENLNTQHYVAGKVNDPDTTLAEMMDALADLPLIFIPAPRGAIPLPSMWWAGLLKSSVARGSIHFCKNAYSIRPGCEIQASSYRQGSKTV
jgi:CubicO group peptidase (beta-lactamase class C family)